MQLALVHLACSFHQDGFGCGTPGGAAERAGMADRDGRRGGRARYAARALSRMAELGTPRARRVA